MGGNRAKAPSERSRVRREPKRAVYERAAIRAILDEALVGHVAFCVDGQPHAIPMLQARVGEVVYLHGSKASRLVRTLAAGTPACLTVTLLDGIVLARSAFNQSVNYRAVVILGRARRVEDETELLAALEAFTERLLPGRWAEVRAPSHRELKATSVLAMPLQECSAKVRSGPPEDDEADYELQTWAGEVPLRTVALPPVPDPRLTPGVEPSPAVCELMRTRGGAPMAGA
jgi:nitroimidazol reductase NimA-like FMN-containing flavoprotein (pyridoxamine 5'-phosphate oxidase superfamily)